MHESVIKSPRKQSRCARLLIRKGNGGGSFLVRRGEGEERTSVAYATTPNIAGTTTTYIIVIFAVLGVHLKYLYRLVCISMRHSASASVPFHITHGPSVGLTAQTPAAAAGRESSLGRFAVSRIIETGIRRHTVQPDDGRIQGHL